MVGPLPSIQVLTKVNISAARTLPLLPHIPSGRTKLWFGADEAKKVDGKDACDLSLGPQSLVVQLGSSKA